ncbi:MAG TPA: aspartate kinase [Methanocorpusculum sp.]|nr:aspartate kinase [Methanocorpusculum sp.]
MKIVMKFGGTSVGNEKCISNVVKIIKKSYDSGDKIAVVVSAMTGVTDQLISITNEIINPNSPDTLIDKFINELKERHLKVLEIVAPDHINDISKYLDSRLNKLSSILSAVQCTHEITPRYRDYIISFGERLSAPIVSAALLQSGIPSSYISGCKAGIITDDVHNGATALPESYPLIQDRIGRLIQTQVPVIMGYMGCTKEGFVTTLGRSGSDYSGAIIGAGIDADEIIIWTDVDGVMTTDPRVIPEARVIKSISFIEMMEMSYFGAKVIHPRALVPAMKKNIMVRVKNTFNPECPGTTVIKEPHADKRVVKAISLIENSCLVTVSGTSMAGKPGVAGEIFTKLAESGVNVMLISQGSSEMTIALVISEDQLPAAITSLSNVKNRGLIKNFEYNRDISVVSVVGMGMSGTYGTLGRIFQCMGKNEINVIMLSQGSEVNISFVVKQSDGIKAIKAIHNEYHLELEDEE